MTCGNYSFRLLDKAVTFGAFMVRAGEEAGAVRSVHDASGERMAINNKYWQGRWRASIRAGCLEER